MDDVSLLHSTVEKSSQIVPEMAVDILRRWCHLEPESVQSWVRGGGTESNSSPSFSLQPVFVAWHNLGKPYWLEKPTLAKMTEIIFGKNLFEL